MQFDALSNKVIGMAIEVHKVLGPGLIESAYESCLARELELAHIAFERQKALPIVYKDVRLDVGYRIDLLIDDALVVEVKSVEGLQPIHEAQLLTYMKLSTCAAGLLMNFNVPLLRDGLKRMVL